MCEYVKINKCSITDDVCPFMYFCERKQIWKPNRAMPTHCKVAMNVDIPHGYNRVVMVRKNKLYIDMGETKICLDNPFETTPLYVKVTKTKSGYKIKQ